MTAPTLIGSGVRLLVGVLSAAGFAGCYVALWRLPGRQPPHDDGPSEDREPGRERRSA